MLPPEVWLGLLVPGIRRPTFTTPPEPRDCSTKAITARPPGPPTEQLPPRPLVESDLTFAPGPDNQILVYKLPFVQSAAAAMTINTPGLIVHYAAQTTLP